MCSRPPRDAMFSQIQGYHPGNIDTQHYFLLQT
ncbi:hypothetical protein A13G_04271, partial [Escherichia coli KTE185]